MEDWPAILREIGDRVFEKAVNDFMLEAAAAGIDDARANIAATSELIDWAAAVCGAPNKELFVKAAGEAWDRTEVEVAILEKGDESVH